MNTVKVSEVSDNLTPNCHNELYMFECHVLGSARAGSNPTNRFLFFFLSFFSLIWTSQEHQVTTPHPISAAKDWETGYTDKELVVVYRYTICLLPNSFHCMLCYGMPACFFTSAARQMLCPEEVVSIEPFFLWTTSPPSSPLFPLPGAAIGVTWSLWLALLPHWFFVMGRFQWAAHSVHFPNRLLRF